DADPERFRGDVGMDASDNLALDERAHAEQAARRREPNLGGELLVGQTSIVLESLENLEVDSIEPERAGIRSKYIRWIVHILEHNIRICRAKGTYFDARTWCARPSAGPRGFARIARRPRCRAARSSSAWPATTSPSARPSRRSRATPR